MLNIDALRAIAAILVVWLHSAEVFIKLSPQVKKAGSFLFDVAWDYDFGRIGVVIFFAISGFVIPSSLRGNRVEGSSNSRSPENPCCARGVSVTFRKLSFNSGGQVSLRPEKDLFVTI